ncbi:choice-of-anchor V domain-containing protein [Rubrivirga sp.]|uniref:choice-of-anchor V domain-containing protein n=1 Tax=Rubrivirga sp. TaxID=1885344 RepID=UPI003C76E32A
MRTLPLLVLSTVAAVGFLIATPAPVQGFSGGAPPNFAGNIDQANGTPRTCGVNGCHATFDLNSGPGSVSISAPSTVAPGDTVRVTVTIDNQTGSRQGFEATVRDPADPAADVPGTLAIVDPSNTQFAQGNTGYVTHTSGGTSETEWQFDWTPDGSVGTARVYVAGNASNGNGASSGDRIYTATADITIASTAGEGRPQLAFHVDTPRPHPVRVGAPSVLEVDLEEPGTLNVRLVDGLGRTVRDVASGDRPAGSLSLSLPTDVPPGTYFVVVQGPGGQRTQPLVVVR